MFARSYVPGRSGQIFIVAEQGNFFLSRPDDVYRFMHGSPWDYDVRDPNPFPRRAFRAAGRLFRSSAAPGRRSHARGDSRTPRAYHHERTRSPGRALLDERPAARDPARRPRWSGFRHLEAALATAPHTLPAEARGRLVRSRAHRLPSDRHERRAFHRRHRSRSRDFTVSTPMPLSTGGRGRKTSRFRE